MNEQDFIERFVLNYLSMNVNTYANHEIVVEMAYEQAVKSWQSILKLQQSALQTVSPDDVGHALLNTFSRR